MIKIMSAPLRGFAFLCIIGILFVSCDQLKSLKDDAESETDTSTIMRELERLYEEAKKRGDAVPENIADWVKQDIKRIGVWEYKIARLPLEETAALEAELNRMGKERWEVFWVEHEGRKASFFMKRPARSYIKSIPLSDLLKVLPKGESLSSE